MAATIATTTRTQPASIANDITIAATKRHRFGRTRLSGCFHLDIEITTAAGAVAIVSGHMSNEIKGSVSAMESYSVRCPSALAARACPAPAATHEGQHITPPISTEQSWHTKRPHCWHAATARLPG